MNATFRPALATKMVKDLPSMDDRELARRLAEGDDMALEALVERHYTAIYRFLWRLVGSEEQARDLTQETLLQVRDSARGFRGKSKFETWILRIAYRVFARYRRKRTLERLSDQVQSSPWYDRTLERIAFESALRELSPKLRDAFTLHALNELSVEETAAVLGIPINTAKARIARARHQLQNQLQNEATTYVAIETR